MAKAKEVVPETKVDVEKELGSSENGANETVGKSPVLDIATTNPQYSESNEIVEFSQRLVARLHSGGWLNSGVVAAVCDSIKSMGFEKAVIDNGVIYVS